MSASKEEDYRHNYARAQVEQSHGSIPHSWAISSMPSTETMLQGDSSGGVSSARSGAWTTSSSEPQTDFELPTPTARGNMGSGESLIHSYVPPQLYPQHVRQTDALSSSFSFSNLPVVAGRSGGIGEMVDVGVSTNNGSSSAQAAGGPYFEGRSGMEILDAREVGGGRVFSHHGTLDSFAELNLTTFDSGSSCHFSSLAIFPPGEYRSDGIGAGTGTWTDVIGDRQATPAAARPSVAGPPPGLQKSFSGTAGSAGGALYLGAFQGQQPSMHALPGNYQYRVPSPAQQRPTHNPFPAPLQQHQQQHQQQQPYYRSEYQFSQARHARSSAAAVSASNKNSLTERSEGSIGDTTGRYSMSSFEGGGFGFETSSADSTAGSKAGTVPAAATARAGGYNGAPHTQGVEHPSVFYQRPLPFLRDDRADLSGRRDHLYTQSIFQVYEGFWERVMLLFIGICTPSLDSFETLYMIEDLALYLVRTRLYRSPMIALALDVAVQKSVYEISDKTPREPPTISCQSSARMHQPTTTQAQYSASRSSASISRAAPRSSVAPICAQAPSENEHVVGEEGSRAKEVVDVPVMAGMGVSGRDRADGCADADGNAGSRADQDYAGAAAAFSTDGEGAGSGNGNKTGVEATARSAAAPHLLQRGPSSSSSSAGLSAGSSADPVRSRVSPLSVNVAHTLQQPHYQHQHQRSNSTSSPSATPQRTPRSLRERYFGGGAASNEAGLLSDRSARASMAGSEGSQGICSLSIQQLIEQTLPALIATSEEGLPEPGTFSEEALKSNAIHMCIALLKQLVLPLSEQMAQDFNLHCSPFERIQQESCKSKEKVKGYKGAGGSGGQGPGPGYPDPPVPDLLNEKVFTLTRQLQELCAWSACIGQPPMPPLFPSNTRRFRDMMAAQREAEEAALTTADDMSEVSEESADSAEDTDDYTAESLSVVAAPALSHSLHSANSAEYSIAGSGMFRSIEEGGLMPVKETPREDLPDSARRSVGPDAAPAAAAVQALPLSAVPDTADEEGDELEPPALADGEATVKASPRPDIVPRIQMSLLSRVPSQQGLGNDVTTRSDPSSQQSMRSQQGMRPRHPHGGAGAGSVGTDRLPSSDRLPRTDDRGSEVDERSGLRFRAGRLEAYSHSERMSAAHILEQRLLDVTEGVSNKVCDEVRRKTTIDGMHPQHWTNDVCDVLSNLMAGLYGRNVNVDLCGAVSLNFGGFEKQRVSCDFSATPSPPREGTNSPISDFLMNEPANFHLLSLDEKREVTYRMMKIKHEMKQIDAALEHHHAKELAKKHFKSCLDPFRDAANEFVLKVSKCLNFLREVEGDRARQSAFANDQRAQGFGAAEFNREADIKLGERRAESGYGVDSELLLSEGMLASPRGPGNGSSTNRSSSSSAHNGIQYYDTPLPSDYWVKLMSECRDDVHLICNAHESVMQRYAAFVDSINTVLVQKDGLPKWFFDMGSGLNDQNHPHGQDLLGFIPLSAVPKIQVDFSPEFVSASSAASENSTALASRFALLRLDELNGRMEYLKKALATEEQDCGMRQQIPVLAPGIDLAPLALDSRRQSGQSQRKDYQEIAAFLQKHQHSYELDNVEAVLKNTRFFHVRFLYEKIPCTLHVSNPLPAMGTEFLRAYIALDGSCKVHSFLHIIKLFTKAHRIDSPQDGFLSSFAWSMMALHVLLRFQILPNIHDNFIYRCDNDLDWLRFCRSKGEQSADARPFADTSTIFGLGDDRDRTLYHARNGPYQTVGAKKGAVSRTGTIGDGRSVDSISVPASAATAAGATRAAGASSTSLPDDVLRAMRETFIGATMFGEPFSTKEPAAASSGDRCMFDDPRSIPLRRYTDEIGNSYRSSAKDLSEAAAHAQALPEDYWNRLSSITLLEMLDLFFRYFVQFVDVSQSVFTLRGSGEILKKYMWRSKTTALWRISIEDPFDHICSRRPCDLGATLTRRGQLTTFKALRRGVYAVQSILTSGENAVEALGRLLSSRRELVYLAGNSRYLGAVITHPPLWSGRSRPAPRSTSTGAASRSDGIVMAEQNKDEDAAQILQALLSDSGFSLVKTHGAASAATDAFGKLYHGEAATAHKDAVSPSDAGSFGDFDGSMSSGRLHDQYRSTMVRILYGNVASDLIRALNLGSPAEDAPRSFIDLTVYNPERIASLAGVPAISPGSSHPINQRAGVSTLRGDAPPFGMPIADTPAAFSSKMSESDSFGGRDIKKRDVLSANERTESVSRLINPHQPSGHFSQRGAATIDRDAPFRQAGDRFNAPPSYRDHPINNRPNDPFRSSSAMIRRDHQNVRDDNFWQEPGTAFRTVSGTADRAFDMHPAHFPSAAGAGHTYNRSSPRNVQNFGGNVHGRMRPSSPTPASSYVPAQRFGRLETSPIDYSGTLPFDVRRGAGGLSHRGSLGVQSVAHSSSFGPIECRSTATSGLGSVYPEECHFTRYDVGPRDVYGGHQSHGESLFFRERHGARENSSSFHHRAVTHFDGGELNMRQSDALRNDAYEYNTNARVSTQTGRNVPVREFSDPRNAGWQRF